MCEFVWRRSCQPWDIVKMLKSSDVACATHTAVFWDACGMYSQLSSVIYRRPEPTTKQLTYFRLLKLKAFESICCNVGDSVLLFYTLSIVNTFLASHAGSCYTSKGVHLTAFCFYVMGTCSGLVAIELPILPFNDVDIWYLGCDSTIKS